MIEHLRATELRFANETALLSGTPQGQWWAPPLNGAAAQRSILGSIDRRDVWRNMRDRQEFGNSWEIATSHHINLDFLHWILTGEMQALTGDGFASLTPEASSKSYVIEVLLPGGQRQRFSGARVAKITLAWKERRAVDLNLVWVALKREITADPLPGADRVITGGTIPTALAQAAMTAGVWGADPRADDAINTFDAQVFLQREISPADYDPGLMPLGHRASAWRCLAEIKTQHTAFTETAFSGRFTGKLALWFGAGDAHIRIENAQGFARDDELKKLDFRERVVGLEAFRDNSLGLMQYYNASGIGLIDFDGTPLVDFDGTPLVDI